ncbi:hypothetical protein [Streptomyces sp. NPDC006355]|uniref:hypothetical protein n=1 Tax=Streptomyces sp. NPDC006355 TaxID=3156758 RepID=UPI0033BA5623
MAETRPVWVIYDDGSTGHMEIPEGDGDPALAKPGRLVTEAEYTARLEEIRAARAARHEAEETARLEAARADYDALIAGGFPEATARRLSGYQGTQAPAA